MTSLQTNLLNAAKIIFALVMITYLVMNFNGPKERHKLYSDVESSVRQKSSAYAQLKAMVCEPSDNTLLLGTNSIRCQVKFLDGKVATVMHKLDARLNSNSIKFKIDRSRDSAKNKAFDLDVGTYQSMPIADLSAQRFTSIIDSVYTSAQDKYNSGAVLSY